MVRWSRVMVRWSRVMVRWSRVMVRRYWLPVWNTGVVVGCHRMMVRRHRMGVRRNGVLVRGYRVVVRRRRRDVLIRRGRNCKQATAFQRLNRWRGTVRGRRPQSNGHESPRAADVRPHGLSRGRTYEPGGCEHGTRCPVARTVSRAFTVDELMSPSTIAPERTAGVPACSRCSPCAASGSIPIDVKQVAA